MDLVPLYVKPGCKKGVTDKIDVYGTLRTRPILITTLIDKGWM